MVFIFFPDINVIIVSCHLVLDASGSPPRHFLQFRHLPLLLCWYHAADNQEDCMAHADYHEDKWCGEFKCCRQHLRWTGICTYTLRA